MLLLLKPILHNCQNFGFSLIPLLPFPLKRKPHSSTLKMYPLQSLLIATVSTIVSYVVLYFYLLRFIQFPKIVLFLSGTVFAYGVTSSGKTHTMHVSLCIIVMHVPSVSSISPTCLAVCFYAHVSSAADIVLLFII